ncbi:excalibur calcium-binding domain-containing protein [Micromonospora sp. LZ34]
MVLPQYQPIADKKRTRAVPWLIAVAVLVGLGCSGVAINAAIDETSPTQPAAQSTTGSGRLVDTRPSPSAGDAQPKPATTPEGTLASPSRSHLRATPTATRTSGPRPAPTTTQPQPPPAPKTDPRFDTCKKANQAGYGPYRRGIDPEYAWYRDPDGDGLVCEPR